MASVPPPSEPSDAPSIKKTRALLWSNTLNRPITWQEIDEIWDDRWVYTCPCELTLLYLRRNSPVYPGAVDIVASIVFSDRDLKDDPTLITPLEVAVLMQAHNIQMVLVTENLD